MELSRIEASLLYRVTTYNFPAHSVLVLLKWKKSCENITSDLDVFAVWKVLRFTWSAWLVVRDRVRRCTVHNVVLHLMETLDGPVATAAVKAFIPPQRPLRMYEGRVSYCERGEGEKTASSWITLIAWLNVRIHMSPHVHSHQKILGQGKSYLTENLLLPAAYLKVPLLQNTKKEVLPLKGSGKAQWHGHHICPALPADRVVVKGAQWWGFPGSLRPVFGEKCKPNCSVNQ